MLPPHFRVVWARRRPKDEYAVLLKHLSRCKIFSVSKPYMVAVTPGAFLHKSVNPMLQHLKKHTARSAETREACARIISESERALRATS